uniref:Uncharacterized protein n=1 Tax=Xiphophorus maculatus TaxID=8083 RepID=A0A3B5PZS7_XIPMA
LGLPKELWSSHFISSLGTIFRFLKGPHVYASSNYKQRSVLCSRHEHLWVRNNPRRKAEGKINHGLKSHSAWNNLHRNKTPKCFTLHSVIHTFTY